MFDYSILCIGRVESRCSEAQSCVVKSAQKTFVWNDSCYSDFKSLRTVFFVRELCPHTTSVVAVTEYQGMGHTLSRALAYCA